MKTGLTGTYRVAKQIGQNGFFAQVTVVVIDRNRDAPFVSLADESQLDLDGQYLEGLTFGATYALNEIPSVESLGIFVTDLQTMPCDSTTSSVAFATCFAVWDALAHTSQFPPYLDEESRAFVFPSECT